MSFHCSHAGPLAIPQTLQEGSNLRIFALAVPSARTHPPTAQIAIMPIPYLWVTIQMLPSQWLTLVILLKTTKCPPLQESPLPGSTSIFLFCPQCLPPFNKLYNLAYLLCALLAVCPMSPAPCYTLTREGISACFVHQRIPSTQNNAWHLIPCFPENNT